MTHERADGFHDAVPLREYLEARLDGLGALMAAQVAGHLALHTSEAEAVALARGVQAHKDERNNNWRSQLESERGLYMTRDAVESRIAVATTDYHALATANATRISLLEQGQANLTGRLWMAGAALTLVITMVGLGIRFLP